jgi:hypothetical protein
MTTNATTKPSRIPIWLVGGAAAWLAYAVTLSALHLVLLQQWGVAYTIKIYSLSSAAPGSLLHILLIAMVAPGMFLMELLSFLHIHSAWVDSAIYNWGKMTFLSSLPAFLVGMLLTASDRRLKLAGSIIGLLLLGGSLLFVLNALFSQ